MALFATGSAEALWVPVVVLGPAPALADWMVTTYGDRAGTNGVRSATGALLGVAYGVAVPWFLATYRPWVIAVGACYGGVAAALLAHSR